MENRLKGLHCIIPFPVRHPMAPHPSFTGEKKVDRTRSTGRYFDLFRKGCPSRRMLNPSFSPERVVGGVTSFSVKRRTPTAERGASRRPPPSVHLRPRSVHDPFLITHTQAAFTLQLTELNEQNNSKFTTKL